MTETLEQIPQEEIDEEKINDIGQTAHQAAREMESILKNQKQDSTEHIGQIISYLRKNAKNEDSTNIQQSLETSNLYAPDQKEPIQGDIIDTADFLEEFIKDPGTVRTQYQKKSDQVLYFLKSLAYFESMKDF